MNEAGVPAGQHRTLGAVEGVAALAVVRRILTGPQSDRQLIEAATTIIPTNNTALDDTITLA